MQTLLDMARALVACAHPLEQVQTVAIDKVDDAALFPPRRIVADRCHQCGAVRMHGDVWIATLGVSSLAATVGAFAAVSSTLVALADHWKHARKAGVALATDWQPAEDAADVVRPAAEIALADLYAYDLAAAGCVPPQVGVPVHAPHLRTLLAAYMTVQAAAVVVMRAEAGPPGAAEPRGWGAESTIRPAKGARAMMASWLCGARASGDR